MTRSTARLAHLVALAATTSIALAACQREPTPDAPLLGALRDMREAAAASERSLGVPADLVLAIAWSETRWQLPEIESREGEHEGHMPASVGVAGIRPSLPGALLEDPVALAASALDVDAERIATDPVAGVAAAAVVLRALAERRYGAEHVPAASDPGAWHEVIADYAGLDDEGTRAAHADAVLAILREGLAADAVDGSRIVIAAREVHAARAVGVAREYGGAEYPGALWSPASTSNYTRGRGGNPIRYVVIHTTQGSYAGTISWFRNPSASVSAHYVIRSSDGEITQMLQESDTGWHAGNWTYNQQSIGIEHEGFVADPGRWYTDAMYRSSAALVRHLCNKYGIPIDRSHIIGHYEVPGATHTDPGSGWDWSRFMGLVRGEPERPAYAASLAGQDHPAEMTSGERAVAWVEYRNDGSAEWRIDRTRLGTSSPDDHASPFYDVENWMNDHRATGADHSGYRTGAVGRFSFMITAPEVGADTTITDTFRLVEEGVTWFGDEVTISVLVHPRATSGPADGDGDGAASDVDCDDASASVYPGAEEICEDGVDQDCDGEDLACEPSGPTRDGGAAGDAGAGGPGGSRPHMDGGCSVAAPGGGAGAGTALATMLIALGALAITRSGRRRART